MIVLSLGLFFGLPGLWMQGMPATEPSATTTPHHGEKHIAAPHEAHEAHESGEEKQGEPPPETFVILDLFSEALEASVAGVGVQIVELKPKVEHVSDMYHNGETHKAFSTALGISTELVLLGVFVETLGIGNMFASALSFPSDWMRLMAQSMVGVMLSTKAALFAGEKVEEATVERYKDDVQAEANARKKGKADHAHGEH